MIQPIGRYLCKNKAQKISLGCVQQEKWIAPEHWPKLTHHVNDWDVSPLTQDDFEFAEGSDDRASEHFIQLSALTEIVDDILRSLFSIKATRKLCSSLDVTLEVAKPFSTIEPMVPGATL